jgi:hypothetical protein
MGEHEFQRLFFVGAQIRFEKGELGGGKLLGAAVIEDGEVRLFVVEAVVGRMAGIFFKKGFRQVRPDIVIAGGEIERDAFDEDALDIAPFAVRRGVVEALDGVADGDYEGGVFGGGFLPDLFVDAGLGFAGAVA